MMDRLFGLAHKMLEFPVVYDSYQRLVGAPDCQRHFMQEVVKPERNERVLDLGCGVGAALEHLDDGVHYTGLDFNPRYIDAAKAEYGARGTFIVADFRSFDFRQLGRFDRAFAFGVLHHLDDATASRLISEAGLLLEGGGKLFTIDPCYVPGQSAIAKFLIDRDRGEHVRDEQGYRVLAGPERAVDCVVHHDLLRVHYTQLIMSMTFA